MMEQTMEQFETSVCDGTLDWMTDGQQVRQKLLDS